MRNSKICFTFQLAPSGSNCICIISVKPFLVYLHCDRTKQLVLFILHLREGSEIKLGDFKLDENFFPNKSGTLDKT